MLEILPRVLVIGLTIGLVLERLKIGRHVLDFILLAILAHSSLFLLHKVFPFRRCLHVPILQRTLIWPSPRISWGHFVVQPGREVIQLQHEMAQPIHHINLLGVRGLSPNHFRLAFAKENLLKRNLTVPVSSNRHHSRTVFLFLAICRELVAYHTV